MYWKDEASKFINQQKAEKLKSLFGFIDGKELNTNKTPNLMTQFIELTLPNITGGNVKKISFPISKIGCIQDHFNLSNIDCYGKTYTVDESRAEILNLIKQAEQPYQTK